MGKDERIDPVVKLLRTIELKPMDGKKAMETLLEVSYLLGFQRIRSWISAGTALGIHRDGKTIEWDTDLDFGILGNNPPEMPPEYELIRTVDTDVPIQRAYMKDGIIVDFFFYYPDGDKLVNRNEVGTITKTASFVESFVPKMPEYLIERYGPSWNVPTGTKRPWIHDCANVT